MTISLVGRKCGMTRVFTEDGDSIPVTVIEVLPNRITQIKTRETDGYNAIQVTTGTCKRSRINKPAAGHYAKASTEPGRGLWEFQIDKLDGLSVGSEINLDQFSIGQMVDVTGTSKGKGYTGVIKRYHFASQDATHGNSLSHRAPGSIGQRQTPGRVFKGKRMAGHMGDVKRTILSQPIIKMDAERHLMFIRGVVPGAPEGDVIIRPAIKIKKKEKKGAN
jgi:large subunit ribosomal protein L3